MISFVMELRGFDELAAALAHAPQDAEQALERGTAAAAPVVATRIAQETPVRTGNLRSSERTLTDGPHAVVFEAAAPYADFVARGTSRQRANPYDQRGVTAAEGEVIESYEHEIGLFVSDFGT